MLAVSSSWLGLSVFVCVAAGTGVGFGLARVLPANHLSIESRDTVRLAIGMVATLAALILGLLIASAKGSYDLKDHEFRQSAANLILLDRVLRHYGPAATEARTNLKLAVEGVLARVASGERTVDGSDTSAVADIEALQDRLRALVPANDGQKWLQTRALSLSGDIAQSRWLLVAQNGSALQVPFLMILIFWLTVIFASFALFAPQNATVVTALLVCCLSVAGAMYLLIELDQPFGGMISISDQPVREAVTLIDKP